MKCSKRGRKDYPSTVMSGIHLAIGASCHNCSLLKLKRRIMIAQKEKQYQMRMRIVETQQFLYMHRRNPE
jgi:hypothetical protein